MNILRRTLIAVCLFIISVSGLHAATANDLIGTWAVDVDASWAKMKAMPQIAALPADQEPQVKAMFMEQMASIVFVFTGDTLTSTAQGLKKEEHYKVTSIDGGIIHTESTDAAGKVEHSTVTIDGDHLIISNAADPAQTVVLKKK